MRRLPFLIVLGMLQVSGPSHAQERPVVGVVAPYSGQLSILGKQTGSGVLAASAGLGLDVTTINDTCDAAGGKAAAEQLVQAKAQAAIGFLCTESLEAALPVLKQHNILAITIGARANSLTDSHDKTGWPLIRLAPRADAETAAAAKLIPALWRDDPFAIIDDGTIAGRELAEAVRQSAEEAQLKPVFVDTYRPDETNQIALAGRLKRAGASHIFVGGNRQDLAILARDAAAIGAPLVLAGGENLRNDESDPPLPQGAIMVGLPDLHLSAKAEVVKVMEDKGIVVEGYVLPAYAAAEIAATALLHPPGQERLSTVFGNAVETVIGPVGVDAKGDLAANPYRLFTWDSGGFVPAEQSQ